MLIKIEKEMLTLSLKKEVEKKKEKKSAYIHKENWLILLQYI